MYVMMATTETESHFYWWGNGDFSERLSILFLIRVFVLFFETMGQASTASVVFVSMPILSLSTFWVHRITGRRAACFLDFTIIQIRHHATEILGDPYATLSAI